MNRGDRTVIPPNRSEEMCSGSEQRKCSGMFEYQKKTETLRCSNNMVNQSVEEFTCKKSMK